MSYATLGFQHDARLDGGHMRPTGFALLELSAAEEKKIVALVRKALTQERGKPLHSQDGE
ncbi:MAG: hypothetical protein U1F45_00750 [Burkholderiales bacterium]